MYQLLLSVLLLTSYVHCAENNELIESPATTVSNTVAASSQQKLDDLSDDLVKSIIVYCDDQSSLYNINLTCKNFHRVIQESYKNIQLKFNLICEPSESPILKFDFFYYRPADKDFPGITYFLRNVQLKSNVEEVWEGTSKFPWRGKQIFHDNISGSIFIPHKILKTTAQFIVKINNPLYDPTYKPKYKMSEWEIYTTGYNPPHLKEYEAIDTTETSFFSMALFNAASQQKKGRLVINKMMINKFRPIRGGILSLKPIS